MANQGLGSDRDPPGGSPGAATRPASTLAAPAHLFGLLLLFIAIAVSYASMMPPAVVPASAGPEAFSAERAMAHVREITKKPHPVGSPGHDAVRDLLMTRLRELGLEPEVTRTFVTQKFFGRYSGAFVENVLARVPSKSGDRRAILFAAHYDAVPQSPGAGDDGSGTAALLESARAIVQGPPLDRDVLFLFTDAEELGLLGAGAFTSEHPAAKDVIAAFNYDARGTQGAVAMFDTSNSSGALLQLLSEVSRVQASSFVTALAKLLPNDTDATIFKKAGVPTMSFAFADGVINYHRATDSFDRLDPRSVQQMGDSMVSLARVLGRGPLRSLEADDVAYFTFFGRTVARFSYGIVRIIALGSFVIVGAAVAFAVKRRGKRGRAIALAAGVTLGAVLVAGAVSAGVGYLLSRSLPFDALLVRSGAAGLVAFSAAAAVVVVALRLAARRGDAATSALGAFAALASAIALIAIFAPGASLPFVFASLACVVPAWACLFSPAISRSATYVASAAIVVVAFPTLYGISIAAAANAPVPVGVLSVPFLIVAAAQAASMAGRRLFIALGAFAALAGIAVARLAWPLGDTSPPRSTVMYGVDADRKQGFFFSSEPRDWMTGAMKRDTAARRTVPELTLTDTEYWLAPPEVAGLSGVMVEKTERRRLSDLFEIRTTLRASPEARCFQVWDEQQRIVDVASVNGKAVRHLIRFSPEKDEAIMRRLRVGGIKPGMFFQFCGMRGEPLEVVFHTHQEAEVPVRLIEVRDGLPPATGGTLLKRPDDEIPTDESERTLVGRTVQL